MKILLVNGSSFKERCTYTGLSIAAQVLQEEGFETEIVWLGTRAIQDCIACMKCRETGKCVFANDLVNEFVEKAKDADGFIFGSPVYYAHPSGRLFDFMDRCFYSGGRHFAFKPAAFISSSRRAGSLTSMEVINKYFSINQMPIVSSTYWNDIHGYSPEDVMADAEGVNTIQNLARNMAWLCKCIEAGKKEGIEHPVNQKVLTNFVR